MRTMNGRVISPGPPGSLSINVVIICLCCTAVLAASSSHSLHASAPDVNSSVLESLLDKAALTFTMPAGFEMTPVITNPDVSYAFAIKLIKAKMEIRYQIITDPYEKKQAFPLNPNKLFLGILMTSAANISQAVRPDQVNYSFYPQESVKEEFGADSGATAAVTVNSAFGKGYKYCLLHCLHKEDTADAFTFCLFDDIEVMKTYFLNDSTAYHALKFK